MFVEISELLDDIGEREPYFILFSIKIPRTSLQMKVDYQVEDQLE
jgi:hypothetical protein